LGPRSPSGLDLGKKLPPRREMGMGKFPPDENGSKEPLPVGKFFAAILRREGREGGANNVTRQLDHSHKCHACWLAMAVVASRISRDGNNPNQPFKLLILSLP
jgi:hypothetical protein